MTADANVPYQAVVTVMEAAGKTGYSNIQLTTQIPGGAAKSPDGSVGTQTVVRQTHLAVGFCLGAAVLAGAPGAPLAVNETSAPPAGASGDHRQYHGGRHR